VHKLKCILGEIECRAIEPVFGVRETPFQKVTRFATKRVLKPEGKPYDDT
jgi:hypothetical protein